MAVCDSNHIQVAARSQIGKLIAAYLWVREGAMTTATAPAIKFSEVLIATDFSDVSDSALAYAKSLARTFESELLLVHVADPAAHIVVPEGAWTDDSARIALEIETTQSAGASLRSEGFKAKEFCAFGGVAGGIAQVAGERHVDLIVTGTHCRKGLNRLIFGSDAESVLRSAHVPVLIVGPKAKLAPIGKWPFHFVLCAVQLDQHGSDVALYSRQFANEQSSKTQTVGLPFYDECQEAEGYLDFKRRLRELLPAEEADRISPVVLPEPAAECLTEVAIARDADLVIFDQRSELLGWPHLKSGLLADVLTIAPCPVLAIPYKK
jgi:nucleotide-binding universal stress UspA family protein